MRKRKLVCAFMATTMLASMVTGCISSDDKGSQTNGSVNSENGEENSEIEKPEKITILATTILDKDSGQADFEKKWEELTGIDIEIIQPDHSAYYDVVGQTFAGGDWPDVVLLGSTYYAGYAHEGALWDMTEAWENSELKASGRMNNEELINSLYLDGKLYGFAPQRGSGCVTYVKKAWLDNVGLDAPTNYEEYIEMLDKFTNGDPDGNGIDGDTYAVSAAGLIGTDAPYTNYLPEFYQDANFAFYQKEDGTWVDGFTEDKMKDAILRLKDAYEKGYIDKETLTNKTSDCRTKFYEDKFGVFTYWAGTWATTLKKNLNAQGYDDELIALEPIEELGSYLERQAPVWAITSKCENPKGVCKYFIEAMLDGGEMQTLWTYGAEGTHWSTKAETVLDVTYEEGQFHMLETLAKPGTLFTKFHIDPLLAVADFKGEDPGISTVAEEAKESSNVFNKNAKLVVTVPSTDEMGRYNGDLTTLKSSIVVDIITQGVSIEDAYARYEKEGGAEWSKAIVDSLNALNK